MDHLVACCHELQQMVALDGSLQPLAERCLDLEATVRDLIRDLETYGAALESDPDRLHALQDRLALLKRLERRHGQDLAGLCERRDALRDQLEPGGADGAVQALELEEHQARLQRDQSNGVLTECRHRVARQLEQDLLAHLRPMGLANVRFQVAVDSSEPGEAGADAVAFLFSANPGQPLAPLGEVASGGEMSRFLLALKTCLAAVDGSSTLLFDEIDTGISGSIAQRVGDCMLALGGYHQIIAITHLPQVAAAGEAHFKVAKTVLEGHTRIAMKRLTLAERREEIAGLISGAEVTEGALRTARELMESRPGRTQSPSQH